MQKGFEGSSVPTAEQYAKTSLKMNGFLDHPSKITHLKSVLSYNPLHINPSPRR